MTHAPHIHTHMHTYMMLYKYTRTNIHTRKRNAIIHTCAHAWIKCKHACKYLWHAITPREPTSSHNIRHSRAHAHINTYMHTWTAPHHSTPHKVSSHMCTYHMHAQVACVCACIYTYAYMQACTHALHKFQPWMHVCIKFVAASHYTCIRTHLQTLQTYAHTRTAYIHTCSTCPTTCAIHIDTNTYINTYIA